MKASASIRTSAIFNKFWFKTVGLCAGAALVLGLALAIVSSSAVLVFAAPQFQDVPVQHLMAGNPQTFSGVVTDAHCGAKHATDSSQSASGCTRLCVKSGSSYALVSARRCSRSTAMGAF